MSYYENSLYKPYSVTTYQPPDYQEWTDGYSYYKPTMEAGLSLSGKSYVKALLQSQGYNPSDKGLTKTGTSSDYIIGIDNYLGTWTIAFGYVPKSLSGYGIPSNISTSVDSYFDTDPEGELINVPGSYRTVTPPIQYINNPIIGWNGGAISIDMFTSNVLAEFSLNQNNVSIFIGLCDQKVAIQDQRYERIKYAVYGHLGTYSIYVDNIKVTKDFTYINSDLFRITISNTRVTFYKNGIEIYSLVKEPDTITYVLDASMYYSSDTIRNAYMESLPTTYYYSNIPLEYSYKLGVYSSNLSLIGFKYKYDILIKKNPDLKLRNKYYANLISVNGSILGGTYKYIGQIENYSSRIEFQYKYKTALLSKNNSVLEGKYRYKMLLEAGGIIPSIPAMLNIRYRYNCFMANPYIRPPQIFINT